MPAYIIAPTFTMVIRVLNTQNSYRIFIPLLNPHKGNASKNAFNIPVYHLFPIALDQG